MIFPARASPPGTNPILPALSLAEGGDSLRIVRRAQGRNREAKETTATLKTRRFLLVALIAGTAAFLLVSLRRRRVSPGPVPYARPEGGEREGEFELFIGS